MPETRRTFLAWSLHGLALASPAAAWAQDACRNRGSLDVLYCDNDGDLVADAPTDPAKLRNPSTLVFTYTPVEDPAVYENILRPFLDHLGKVTGKKIAVKEGPRRPGDPPELVAAADAVRAGLGWTPKYAELRPIIETAWKWHKAHPRGYADR